MNRLSLCVLMGEKEVDETNVAVPQHIIRHASARINNRSIQSRGQLPLEHVPEQSPNTFDISRSLPKTDTVDMAEEGERTALREVS